MAVTYSDLNFLKSVVVTNTTANGGRKGWTEITRTKHGLFPRVTKSERDSGVTRYRKMFIQNKNASEDSAANLLFYLKTPSNAQDAFFLGLAEQNDTQSDITTTPPAWAACGQLNTGLSGSETQIIVDMETDEAEFTPYTYIYIHNQVATSQTVDDGSIPGRPEVLPGDSCQYVSGSWRKISATENITYPYGIYIGSDAVLTDNSSNSEFLPVAINQYTDEDIGDGDGIDTSPTLTTLAGVSNGLELQYTYRPVVTATCGGTPRYVYIDTDGTCSGYCSAGEINPATGAWTTDITWTTAPDSATDITITYYDKCYSYSGNTVTIDLLGPIANAYSTSNTYVSGCLYFAEITPSVEDWTETAAVSGTYDESSYPLVMYNDGCEYDEWTLTFTSATAFTVSGTYSGSVGTGDTSTDFEPANPNGTNEYFKIDKDGWGGTWQTGDTVTFTTNPSAAALWWKEVVPSSAAAAGTNACIYGMYWE